MTNRTAAVMITIGVLFLFGCPGVLLLCNGLFALVEIISNGNIQIIGYGYNAPYWMAASFCLSILAFLIIIVVAILVLRRKTVTPPSNPDEPIPPPM